MLHRFYKKSISGSNLPYFNPTEYLVGWKWDGGGGGGKQGTGNRVPFRDKSIF